MNYNIPGIDIEKAIKNSGSEELFTELLGDVYKLMDEKSAMVETFIRDKDLQNRFGPFSQDHLPHDRRD